MSNWLADILLQNKKDRIPSVIRRFGTADATLSRDTITVEGAAWLVEAKEDQVVRLFEVAAPDAEVEQCLLTYRASLKSEDLKGRAFLEMWCRFPGRGEFFSRGLNQPLKGTTAWTSHETPFRLKKGQRPDLIKLNLAVEGRGKIWITDVELLKMPR
ncbi:MAG: hypothetical protein A2133_04690 [Actinobacteria bacterium RBG_16_64_13]|nr:MAG: hypothetical protein A2133_04690 [Actinobacteria bacterium RBG_16_64_13]